VPRSATRLPPVHTAAVGLSGAVAGDGGRVELDAEPRALRHLDHAVVVDRQRLLQEVVAQAVRVLVKFEIEAVRDGREKMQ
jgi:hypothetical protein